MNTELSCPYCGEGGKSIDGPGCCGESAAHFVERELSLTPLEIELVETLTTLVVATTMAGPVLKLAIDKATKLIDMVEGKS